MDASEGPLPPSAVRQALSARSTAEQRGFAEEYGRRARTLARARRRWLALGSHHGYLGRWGLQVLFWLTTAFLLGLWYPLALIWWGIDFLRLATLVRRANDGLAARIFESIVRASPAGPDGERTAFRVTSPPGSSAPPLTTPPAAAPPPVTAAVPPPPMVDVEAPPVPARTTTLRRAPARVVLKKIGTALLGVGAMAVVAVLVAFFIPVAGPYIAVLLVVVALLVLPFMIFDALRGRLGSCPFCSSTLGEDVDSAFTRSKTAQQVRCDACSEYSVLQAGVLRAHDPTSVADTRMFRSPAFKDAVWPRGCVACGGAPTRFVKLSATDVKVTALLVGVFSYARGEVAGIPYCDAHEEAVSLHVDDRRLYFLWTSLPMMRRYLEANRRFRRA